MAEQTFNEAERYLLDKWDVAVEVEEVVESVRDKYQQLFDQIAEVIRSSDKGLTTLFANAVNTGGPAGHGAIVIGRESWPKQGKSLPTAFWAEYLRMEVLIDHDGKPPTIGFWLAWNEDENDPVYEEAREAILAKARKEFSPEELSKWTVGNDYDDAVIGRQIASKKEILDLLSQGRTKEFVELVVGQFEELLRIPPAIDEALDAARKKAKA